MSILIASALYRPVFSGTVIGLMLLLVVCSGVLAARRERVWWPLGFRLVAVVALGWVLLGYSETRRSHTSGAALPTLAILVDTSLSMAQQDVALTPGGDTVTRLQAVQNQYLNSAMLNRLGALAEVELIAFDEQSRPAFPQRLAAQGQVTALHRAAAQSQADATLILSDGHDTTRQAASSPPANAGRLFAVPVGTARSAPDLALQAWPDSDRLFEDQSTMITASIQQSGLAGQQAVVELLYDDQVVGSKLLMLDGRAMTARFRVSPPLAVGQRVQANHYTARVRLVGSDEAYTANNTEHLFIQTTRGQIKVLLIEGEPYWDTRSLARLITGHPRFDLTALYGFGENRRSERIGQAVEGQEALLQNLEQFDIVVLGRQVQRLVDPGFADRLSRYVSDGGAVVFARGKPYDGQTPSGFAERLDAISPVDWAEPVLGEMRVRLSGQADRQGVLAGLGDGEVLSRLPGMLAATRIAGRKSASLVMLEQAVQGGPTMAAMTSLRIGSGTSLAVLTEGLWRWELLPGVPLEDVSDEEQGGAVNSMFGVLWVRALQWLASDGAFLPGQDIAIEADRLTAEPNQPIQIQVSTRYVEAAGLPLELTATHPDGTRERLLPTLDRNSGVHTATMTPTDAGVYTVQVRTPGREDLIEPGQPLTTRFAVIDRSAERRDTSAKPDALQQLVEPTGGQCLNLGQIDPVLTYLQSLHALRGGDETVDYAFSSWPVFALIAGCFGLEWLCRRRIGLR